MQPFAVSPAGSVQAQGTKKCTVCHVVEVGYFDGAALGLQGGGPLQDRGNLLLAGTALVAPALSARWTEWEFDIQTARCRQFPAPHIASVSYTHLTLPTKRIV